MSSTHLPNRTVLITGGTGGIGLATARRLAQTHARVLLVGRDQRHGVPVRDRLRHDTGNDRIEFLPADVTSRSALLDLADTVGEQIGTLDVLINNAGGHRATRTLTPDGVEADFGMNVLAPFTLAHLLRPALRRSDDARIVNLTGGIPKGRIMPGNLQAEKRYVGITFSQYNHTKLALMAMSRVLARRFANDRITVNVGYPGHAWTPGNRAMPARAFPWLYRPIVPVLRLLGPRLLSGRAVERATRSSVYLASDADMSGHTDGYYGTDGRRLPWPAAVESPDNQRAVWGLCARLASIPD